MTKIIKLSSLGKLQEETSIAVSTGAGSAGSLVHLNAQGKFDTSVLPNFADANKIQLMNFVSGSNNPTGYGFSASTSGTVATRTITTGNTLNRTPRLGISTGGGGNGLAGLRWTTTYNIDDGFTICFRFGLASSMSTACRYFVGLQSTSANPVNVAPNSLTNILGVGKDNGDTNLKLFHNDGTGTATTIDLGVNFPCSTINSIYEVIFYALPIASSIIYTVNKIDGTLVSTSGTISTDLVSNTVFLAPQNWQANNGTGVATILDIISFHGQILTR